VAEVESPGMGVIAYKYINICVEPGDRKDYPPWLSHASFIRSMPHILPQQTNIGDLLLKAYSFKL
jgi:hypothetical protein